MEEEILNFLKINGIWWVIGFIFLYYLKEFISNLAKSHSEAVAKEMNIKIPKIIETSKSFIKKYSFIFGIICWYVSLQFALYWQLKNHFPELQLLSLLGAFNVFFAFIVAGFGFFYFFIIADERRAIMEIMFSLHKVNLENILELQKMHNQNISQFANKIENIVEENAKKYML